MEEFTKIFNQHPVNVSLALQIYGSQIEVRNPTQKNKIAMHKAMTMFSEYWRLCGHEINNIYYLSSFAAVFVDQMLFINEYEEVCAAIKRVIDREQFRGVQSDWRSSQNTHVF